MTSKTVLLACSLALLLPAGALHSGGAQSPGIRIVERWATKGAVEVVEFGYINGMAELADGTVWVSDDVNHVVVALSPQGVPLRIAARTGDGPGEVAAPTVLAPLPGGGVAVYDMGHDAVELFGGDGAFLRRTMLDQKIVNPKGMAVLPGGDVVISGGSFRSPHALHRFGPDGKLRESRYPIPQTRNPRAGMMVAGGPLHALPDGGFLFSQAAPHRILHFPPDGEPREVARNPDRLDPVGDDFVQKGSDGTRRYRWWFPQSRAVFRLADGTILNVVRNRDEDLSIWELYTPAGRLRAAHTVRRAYEPFALARNGDVLAAYRDPDTDEHVAVRLALLRG